MKVCIICGKRYVRKFLDFGMQPISSHYVADTQQTEYKHTLSLGQCSACGVIQLFDRFPWKKLVPLYPWTVRYTEPEEHLDDLTQTIAQLPSITKNSNICGLSFKDDTLLERLRKKGFRHCLRFNSKDLGISGVHGVESVQHKFSKAIAEKIVRKIGKQDVLIVRHLLEHVYDPAEFIDAAKEILTPHGYLVIEVPGVDKAINYFDYATIWEEHLLYFTRETFQKFFAFYGYRISHFMEISYPLENSLIAIVYQDKGDDGNRSEKVAQREREKFKRFTETFPLIKKRVEGELLKSSSILLFGAGHLGCIWVNIFQLAKYIGYYVDDDINKVGLCIPGSRIPILRPSEITKSIDLCLLSSNPQNDQKIKANNKKLFSRVKLLESIFPQTKIHL